MRPQAPSLPFDGPPFCPSTSPADFRSRFHVVGTWGGRHAGRIQMGGKERHHPLCLPATPPSQNTVIPSQGTRQSIPRTKIRLLNAHSCLPASTTSGRSPGLPGDHRAGPDPGRPPLEAGTKTAIRPAISDVTRLQGAGLGCAVVFFLEASSKEEGRPGGAYALQLVGLDASPR